MSRRILSPCARYSARESAFRPGNPAAVLRGGPGRVRIGLRLLVAAHVPVAGLASSGAGASPRAGSGTCSRAGTRTVHRRRAPARVTITSSGPSPNPSHDRRRQRRVTFVNNDAIPHDVAGGPDPDHRDCPEIDAVGFLTPGQSRQTQPFDARADLRVPRPQLPLAALQRPHHHPVRIRRARSVAALRVLRWPDDGAEAAAQDDMLRTRACTCTCHSDLAMARRRECVLRLQLPAIASSATSPPGNRRTG